MTHIDLSKIGPVSLSPTYIRKLKQKFINNGTEQICITWMSLYVRLLDFFFVALSNLYQLILFVVQIVAGKDKEVSFEPFWCTDQAQIVCVQLSPTVYNKSVTMTIITTSVSSKSHFRCVNQHFHECFQRTNRKIHGCCNWSQNRVIAFNSGGKEQLTNSTRRNL